MYKQVLPKINAYIKANNGQRDDALDVFHDGIMIIIRKLKIGDLCSSQDLNGFMYVTCKNLWINKVIKNKKNILVEQFDDKELVNESIEEALHLKEKNQEIHEILGQLGPKCFKIMKAIIYDDLSYKEIAKKLEFSSSDVVKTTKNRCKKKLLNLVDINPKVKDFFKR